jgi:hypothetical protein
MRAMGMPGEGRSEEPEWVVWLTVVICLLIGWVIATTVSGRTETVPDGAGGSITIPATWIKTKEAGALFAATDLNAGTYGSRISVRQVSKADLLPPRSGDTLEVAASNWTLIRSPELEGYRVLQIAPTTIQGRNAVAIEYAYLTDPPQGGGTGVMPGLMHAIDTIVASGDGFVILTVATEQGDDTALEQLLATAQAGWQIP